MFVLILFFGRLQVPLPGFWETRQEAREALLEYGDLEGWNYMTDGLDQIINDDGSRLRVMPAPLPDPPHQRAWIRNKRVAAGLPADD